MKDKPRVLLLSASSGAGHLRAAQALEKALVARGDCIVEHIDAMKYASKLFQSLYHKTYISLANRAPDLLGLLYDRTDQPWNQPRPRLAVDAGGRPLHGAARRRGRHRARCSGTGKLTDAFRITRV
jgi:hypothetical protein